MAKRHILANQWTCLGVMLALLVTIELANLLPYWRPAYWSARSALNAAKTSIHERGEPVSFADLAAENEGDYATGDRVLAIVKEFTKPEPEFSDLIRADPPTAPGDYATLRETIRINREALDALAAINPAAECRIRYDFGVASPSATFFPVVDGLERADYALAGRSSPVTGDRG